MTKVLSTVAELQHYCDQLKAANKTLALVPTMGNLHEGHLALMKLGNHHADEVMATIFVNPTQFAAGEDLDNYPRTLAADIEKLTSADVNAVFVPTEEMMYPNGKENSVVIDIPSPKTLKTIKYPRKTQKHPKNPKNPQKSKKTLKNPPKNPKTP